MALNRLRFLSSHGLKIPAITLLVLGGAVVLFYRPVLQGVGDILVHDSARPDQLDAVVLLYGGVPDRVLEAADLLKKYPGSIALLSTGYFTKQDLRLLRLGIRRTRDHEINAQILEKFGIEKERLHFLPGEVRSTWEEALAARKYSEGRSLESLAVVTCPYHSYRAYLNFQKAFDDTHVAIYSVPSKYCEEFNPQAWWQDRDQIKTLYMEFANLTAFFLGFR